MASPHPDDSRCTAERGSTFEGNGLAAVSHSMRNT